MLVLSACSVLYEITVFNPCESTRTVVLDEIFDGSGGSRVIQRTGSVVLPGTSAVIGSVSDSGTYGFVQVLESDWVEEVVADESVTISLPPEVCEGNDERAFVTITTSTHSRIRMEAIGTSGQDMAGLITRAAREVGLDLDFQRLQTGAFQFGGETKLLGRDESVTLELDRIVTTLLDGGFTSVELTVCDWHQAIEIETELTGGDGACQSFRVDERDLSPAVIATIDGAAFYEGEPSPLLNTAIGVLIITGGITGLILGIRSTMRSRRLRAANTRERNAPPTG